MRHLLGVTIPIVLLGAIALASVHLFEDRELFVAPPDAVAEGFARAVITCRYDQARAFLIDPHAVTNDELRAWKLVRADRVEAEIVSRDAHRALVRVRLSPDALTLSLVFDREWKVSLRGSPRLTRHEQTLSRLRAGSRAVVRGEPAARREGGAARLLLRRLAPAS